MKSLEKAIRNNYDLTGHNSLMLRNLIRKAEVALCSALPNDVVSKMGLHPLASLEEGLRWILERFPRDFSYVVVPYANVICAAIESGQSHPTETSNFHTMPQG